MMPGLCPASRCCRSCARPLRRRAAGDHGHRQEPERGHGRGAVDTAPTTTSPSRSTFPWCWRGSKPSCAPAAVSKSETARRDQLRRHRPRRRAGGEVPAGGGPRSGNFGAVYRATHLEFQQPVAVKILQTPVDDTSETLARFRQEGMLRLSPQAPQRRLGAGFQLHLGRGLPGDGAARRAQPGAGARTARPPAGGALRRDRLADLQRAFRGPRPRHHPPRHQARQHLPPPAPPRRGGQGARLRHRQAGGRGGDGPAPDPRRGDPRHAGVHGPGAHLRRRLRRPLRRLRRRRGALPDAVGLPARSRWRGKTPSPSRCST